VGVYLYEYKSDLVSYFYSLCLFCEVVFPEELFDLLDVESVFKPKPLPIDPGKNTYILIVDDSLSELLKTAMAFIGWPNLSIGYYYFVPSMNGAKKDDEETNLGVAKADLERTVRDIIAINPEIILMDQGLESIKGYTLIEMLKKISTKFFL